MNMNPLLSRSCMVRFPLKQIKNIVYIEEGADSTAECDFHREIEIMKKIGYYERLGSRKRISNKKENIF